MSAKLAERTRDETIVLARLLLVLVFLVFGWGKLTDHSVTAAYMGSLGVPAPGLAARVAIGVETLAALALAIGLLTRPVALLFVAYTLAAGLIRHRSGPRTAGSGGAMR